MKVCVLLPDYSTSKVDYQYFDPPRDLQPLLPNDQVDTVFLNKLTTYKQLKDLSHKGYDIFVNLCEGYLEWEVPSIEVIYFLELLQLPFTGPTSQLYDPPKDLMKYVAYGEQVKTPDYFLVKSVENIRENKDLLQFPLFVKPAKAGDSLGVDAQSLTHNQEELEQKCQNLLQEYDEILVEKYIAGREFTVMVAANEDGKTVRSFKPVEYIFPDNFAFKTYALKTSELHPNANIPCTDSELETRLREAAIAIFKGFFGKGYARLDFRVNDEKEIYFLEINFTCSVFYTNGYEGSADFILQYDGTSQTRFLQHIIKEGLARHRINQKKYIIKGSSTAGFGIFANQNIMCTDVIFNLEESAQRITTLEHVERNWNIKEKEIFAKYAYPISKEVFLLWSDNPQEWAPQNHSCAANTKYQGLNVIATRNISKGEELTLDYSSFLDEHMEPFVCACGSASCKGFIQGIPGNTITHRAEMERLLNQMK